MTNWTAADLPDLTGRTIIVTGASGGIGRITARELARAGARVVLAVRDVAKGADAAASMSGRTEVRELDVSSLDSVHRFADAWQGDIDVLINNAGIMQVPFALTADGFESQAATNFFGPFALTNLLLPRITDRVVTVSSQLHRMGHSRPDDLNWSARKYDALAAYNDSKLNELLFSLELQARLAAEGRGVLSVVAHPGIAHTGLVSHAGGFTGGITRLGPLLNDAEHGALPSLFAATQDVAGNAYVGPNGLFSVKGYPVVRRAAKAAYDATAARALWDAAAALTGTGASIVA